MRRTSLERSQEGEGVLDVLDDVEQEQEVDPLGERVDASLHDPTRVPSAARRASSTACGDGSTPATTAEEWAEGVRTLLDDADRWERMSRSAHGRARQRYSLAVLEPVVVNALVRLSGVGCVRADGEPRVAADEPSETDRGR